MRFGLKIFFNKKFMEKKLYTEQEVLDYLEKSIYENVKNNFQENLDDSVIYSAEEAQRLSSEFIKQRAKDLKQELKIIKKEYVF